MRTLVFIVEVEVADDCDLYACDDKAGVILSELEDLLARKGIFDLYDSEVLDGEQ